MKSVWIIMVYNDVDERFEPVLAFENSDDCEKFTKQFLKDKDSYWIFTQLIGD